MYHLVCWYPSLLSGCSSTRAQQLGDPRASTGQGSRAGQGSAIIGVWLGEREERVSVLKRVCGCL